MGRAPSLATSATFAEFNLGHAPRQIILRVGDGRLRLGRAQPAALPLDAVQTVGARRARLG